MECSPATNRYPIMGGIAPTIAPMAVFHWVNLLRIVYTNEQRKKLNIVNAIDIVEHELMNIKEREDVSIREEKSKAVEDLTIFVGSGL